MKKNTTHPPAIQPESKKQPYMPFYPGDWKKDAGVQLLSFFERHVWFEMLLLMHDSEERGILVVNGHPMTEEEIAMLINLDNQIFISALEQIKKRGVCGIRDDGAIFSRSMVRRAQMSQVRTEAGKMGGNPILLNQKTSRGGYPNADIDIDIDIDPNKGGPGGETSNSFRRLNVSPIDLLGFVKLSDHVQVSDISHGVLRKRYMDEGLGDEGLQRAVELLDLHLEKNPHLRKKRCMYKDLIGWPLTQVRLDTERLKKAQGVRPAPKTAAEILAEMKAEGWTNEH